jgi:hypothetical protein
VYAGLGLSRRSWQRVPLVRIDVDLLALQIGYHCRSIHSIHDQAVMEALSETDMSEVIKPITFIS